MSAYLHREERLLRVLIFSCFIDLSPDDLSFFSPPRSVAIFLYVSTSPTLRCATRAAIQLENKCPRAASPEPTLG